MVPGTPHTPRPAGIASDQLLIVRVQSIIHGAEDVTHLASELG